MKTLLLLASAMTAIAVVAAEPPSNPPLLTRPSGIPSPAPSGGGGRSEGASQGFKNQTFSENASQKTARPEPPPFNSPAAMQAEFVRRFEASPGFGLSRVLRPIFLAPTPALVHNGTTYTVVPPELVALEDDPVVYAPHEHAAFRRGISTNVTVREVRKLFAHRPLNALETNLVAALREGRDLIVVTNHVARPEAQLEFLDPPALLVYGALRANKTCAECHQCAPGTLLGAFAYTLNPVLAAADNRGTTSALHGITSITNLVARLSSR